MLPCTVNAPGLHQAQSIACCQQAPRFACQACSAEHDMKTPHQQGVPEQPLTDSRMPVQYASHADAVQAILGLNGEILGGKALKCSWGKHRAQLAGTAPLHPSVVRARAFNYPALLQQQDQQQATLQQQMAVQQLCYPQE